MKNLFTCQSLLLTMTVKVVVSEGKIDHLNRSPLSNMYGCLETTNIIVFADINFPSNFKEYSRNLFDHLKTNCTLVFVYFQKSQKLVQWSDDLHNVFESEIPKSTSTKEKVEIIQTLQEQHQHDISKQVLLYFHIHTVIDINVLKKLKKLDVEQSWNVILVCDPNMNCPNNRIISIHRIVPIILTIEYRIPNFVHVRNQINSLIDNPDFNKFELLRHIKFEDKRLKCLKGKTIHVISTSQIFSHKLFEDIVLILYRTQSINTKIVVRLRDFSFWNFFIKENMINSERIIFKLDDMRDVFNEIKDPARDHTNNIYMIQTNYLLYYHSFCINSTPQGHKSAVFYFNTDTINTEDTIETVIIYSMECKYKYEKIFIKKYYMGEFWLEDVLNAACL